MNKEERLIKDLKDSAKKDLAFETLVNLYKQKLYFQIRRIVLNHDDTDDVLQYVFIKVYKGINKFKGLSKLIDSDQDTANLIANQLLDNALATANLLDDPREMIARSYQAIEKLANG